MSDNIHEKLLSLYEDNERFKVDNDDKANWALRKIMESRRRIKEYQRQAEVEMERIDSWLREVQQDEEKSSSYFEGLLAVYLMERRRDNPKMRVLKLPLGRVKSRILEPDFQKDEAVLLEWAKNSVPDVVESVEKLKWAELKKCIAVGADGKAVYTETGEVVAGLSAVLRGERIYVEVYDEKNNAEADSRANSG